MAKEFYIVLVYIRHAALKDVRAKIFHSIGFLLFLLQSDKELLVPEMQKKIGGHRLRFLARAFMHDAVCECACAEGCAQTISANVLNLKGHVTRSNFSCNLQRNDDE